MSYMNETRKGIFPNKQRKRGSIKRAGLRMGKIVYGFVDTIAVGFRGLNKKQ